MQQAMIYTELFVGRDLMFGRPKWAMTYFGLPNKTNVIYRLKATRRNKPTVQSTAIILY